VSSSRDKTIKIWDTSGTLQTTLVHHGLQVTCAAFSQNIEQLVSSAEDGTVIVWDLTTETPLNTLNTDIVVSTVRFSASGSSVETDRGVLDITSPSDPPSHALPQQPSSPLFVAREWVRCGSQNLLWLRQDYRPISVANKNEKIVLGHSSGAISFLKLKHS
jgi:WD40 repeat protein